MTLSGFCRIGGLAWQYEDSPTKKHKYDVKDPKHEWFLPLSRDASVFLERGKCDVFFMSKKMKKYVVFPKAWRAIYLPLSRDTVVDKSAVKAVCEAPNPDMSTFTAEFPMFRPAWLFTSMLTVTMLTTPQLAFAWSEQHFPVTTSDGEKFADPDEKIERMAEPTSDHAVSLGSSFGSQTNKSGWSFSVTPQDSFAQSPYAMPRNLRAPNIGR